MSAGNIDPKLIESIPPALLKILPAGQPPPGIQSNFADPLTRVPVILGVSIAFVVLAVFCFSIRIYTKLALAKNWQWDDLTCSLGFMCSIVHLVALVNGCINGAAGRHMWDLYLDKVLNKTSLYQDYITTIMVTPALGLIKFSLFIQYYLLFHPLRWIRISVWIGATSSALFYIAVTIIAFVLESPWPGESLLEDILSWHHLKFAQFSIPTGVIGMLVDWYLLILPIPAVLTLQMSTAKKLGVLIVFMTGGFAAIASVVSLYYRVQLQDKLSDPTWNVGYVSLWAQVEMFAGVIASSMPTVKQFFSRQIFSLTSLNFSSIGHLRSRSARVKLSDDDPSFTGWGGSNTHTSEGREGFRMKGLESDGYKQKVEKAPRVRDSKIYLTRDISNARESLDNAPSRPVVIGRHR
ncbi:MAG: hypothetical protein ASARMPREDX12_008782 [Alectoria sarmentosa]|nr:MAG: hypothetical protein ASARMPREDX12_008782 [Alectoria sarmentosa]